MKHRQTREHRIDRAHHVARSVLKIEREKLDDEFESILRMLSQIADFSLNPDSARNLGFVTTIGCLLDKAADAEFDLLGDCEIVSEYADKLGWEVGDDREDGQIPKFVRKESV